MNFKTKKTRYFIGEINIAPLVDMIFLLLIFLLISTTFKKREYAFILDLPTASQKDLVVHTDTSLIFVTKSGDFFLSILPKEGEEETLKPKKLSYAELKDELKKLAETNPDTPISVRGEKETDFQTLMDVINACYEAGLRAIQLPYEYKEENQ